MNLHRLLLGIAAFTLLATSSQAAEIRVATAANFRAAMDTLAARYELETGHQVVVISGSTGKHFAQIINGAPFHAYFAADDERPRLLEEKGVAIRGSRFTYALGTLALWSREAALVQPGTGILEAGEFRHLAIANPELAPYGRAAREALQSLGLWATLSNRLVLGENVSQAFQFVHSGNAELGLVAWTQVRQHGASGSFWRVPAHLHSPIEQQAVLLVDEASAREFMDWVRGDIASAIILDHGYGQP